MKVICISGKAGHGKDTAAEFLKAQLELGGNKVLITHYADLVKYICKELFGWDGKKDEKGRALLQYVGTDIVRSRIPDYWVRFISDMLGFFGGEWDYVLIPDCRFWNEVNYLIESGFDVTHMRVVRDGYDSGLTEEQKNHPSETDLDDCIPDIWVDNNGYLADFYDNLLLAIDALGI